MEDTRAPSFIKSVSNDNVVPASGMAAAFDNAFLSGVKTLSDAFSAHRNAEPFLNNFELISVRALVLYTAYSKKISEERVHALIVTRFGADDISKIHSRDYDDVVRYLADLKP
jgi:hypothetical protein